MFEQETIARINRTAEEAGLEPAALLAVAEVESAGKAFATVGGRREPLIRFEGHYFDRRLTGAKQAQARAAGLASPKAGGVANPRTQAGRWDLLERACAIDRKAAWESVCRQGDVLAQLTEELRSFKPQLLVMVGRGRDSVLDFLLPGKIEQVASLAACPLLVQSVI